MSQQIHSTYSHKRKETCVHTKTHKRVFIRDKIGGGMMVISMWTVKSSIYTPPIEYYLPIKKEKLLI